MRRTDFARILPAAWAVIAACIISGPIAGAAGPEVHALATQFPSVCLDHPDGCALLDYCLAHRSNCSITINYISEGWERHFNGEQLNSLASTFKVIPLIAYAQAVWNTGTGREPWNHQVWPNQQIQLVDWAHYWIGLDGGALANSWSRMGYPSKNISLDQMVRGMIQNSDNAAADYLLNLLGKSAMADVISQYISGYMDVPNSYAAIFTAAQGQPAAYGSKDLGFGVPADALGHYNVSYYSGFADPGYQRELDSIFAEYTRDPQAVQAERDYLCQTLPWVRIPWYVQFIAPCSPANNVTEEDARKLSIGYFMRSNTNTYTKLMTHLLKRDLLPQGVQQIVEPHMEWWLSLPNLSNVYYRFGGKGGGLGTSVSTWTGYAQTKWGSQAALTIQLHDPTPYGNQLNSVVPGVSTFLDALLTDVFFANLVRDSLPEDPAPPYHLPF